MNLQIVCYIYDVSVEDMGHYYLQITEVEDNTNIVHAKIDMNLFVKAAPRVTFADEDIPKGWLPDGYCQIFRLYLFGPSGFKDYGSATLRCKI